MFSSRKTVLLAGAALCLAFAASSASAQDYDRYGQPVSYGSNGPEEITVYAPRDHASTDRSSIGAPIENVSLSRAVSYGDLDLTTGRGARELRDRVYVAARVLCQQIHIRYPITEGDRDSCYRETVADAQDRVDDTIERVRYGD